MKLNRLFALAACALVAGSPALAAELNAYSIMPEKYAAPVLQQFEKATGIHVNFQRLSSGEALARLVAEKNNPRVDVILGGPSDVYQAGMKEGVFASYKSPSFDAIDANLKDADGYWTGIGIIPLCLLTNNQFLADHNLQAPTSWQDLLDPAYEKGLQMADARTSGTATERIYTYVQLWGEDGAYDYQKKLHQNVQLYTKSGAGGAMPVATGQAASGVFYICDAMDIADQGYPVTITYPKEGVTYGIEASGIVAGAKNEEAAKQFIDWVTGPEFAQFIVANHINYVPTNPSIKPDVELLDLSKINLLQVDTAWKGENRERFVQRWIDEVIK